MPGFAASDSVKPNGVIGGGQIGYNSQQGNFIFGIEADFQGSGEKASRNRTDPFASLTDLGNSQFFSLSGRATTDYEAKISWFGTLRGRVGYLITPNIFAYAMGGLAYGRVELSGTINVSGTGMHLDCTPQPANPCIPGGAIPFGGANSSFGNSSVNLGWTLGGGFQGALWDRWSWKAEYLYIDLGSMDDPSVAVSATVGAITTHTHFTDNIVRVGLNYQFH